VAVVSSKLTQGQNGGPNDKCVEEDGPNGNGTGSDKWQLLVTTHAEGQNGGLNGRCAEKDSLMVADNDIDISSVLCFTWYRTVLNF
jgi:hypothetical protein